MPTLLENELRARALSDDSAARIFLAQWEIDSRLLEQALKSIALSFPHFSLHDATHSRRIQGYIGEILGPERIRRLSAATIWLLLSASYYHDTGMIIPDNQARKWWQDGTLTRLIEKALRDPTSELHSEALLLSDVNIRSRPDWPLEVRRAVTLIVASHGREVHAERSLGVVQEPMSYGISSPRSDLLIPRRIWGVLSKICKSHGESIDSIFSFRKEANGITEGDKIHPRFVAAMLRLGDLLDLDNGRFCPTMRLHLGRVPAMSILHEGKHASIEHFLVTQDQIEAVAKCPDQEIFDTTSHWLTMLKSELEQLSLRWGELAPVAGFGTLPAAGTLEARLPKHIVSERGRPEFQVDTPSMLKLFRDTGLYPDPKQEFIREFLQNAYDATILRLKEENNTIFNETGPKRLQKARDALQAYPVEVSIQSTNGHGVEGEASWSVTFRDHGTGIPRSAITTIRNVGSSTKTSLSHQFPDWLTLSGAFGVGLQAAFYATDLVTILTHDIDTRDATKIEVFSERGVFAFKWTPQSKYDFGTSVKVVLAQKKIPDRVYTEGDHVKLALKDFDMIRDEEIPYVAARVIDALKTYSQALLIPVKLTYNGKALSLNQRESPLLYSSDVAVQQRIFAVDNRRVRRGSSQFFYRGAPLQKVHFGLFWGAWMSAGYDLYFGSPVDIITLNRSDFRAEDRVHGEIEWRCASATLEHLQVESESSDWTEAHAASAIVIAKIIVQAAIDVKGTNQWAGCEELASKAQVLARQLLNGQESKYSTWPQHIPLTVGNDGRMTATLGQALEVDGFWAWQSSDGPNGAKVWRASVDDPRAPLQPDGVDGPSSAGDGDTAFRKPEEYWALFGRLLYVASSDTQAPFLHFIRGEEFDPSAPYEAMTGDSCMYATLRRIIHSSDPVVGFRYLIPLWKKFLPLAIRTRAGTWAMRIFHPAPNGAYGIFPLRVHRSSEGRRSAERLQFSAPGLPLYAEWVYQNRANTGHSRGQVINALREFLVDAHEVLKRLPVQVRADTPAIENFSLEEALRILDEEKRLQLDDDDVAQVR